MDSTQHQLQDHQDQFDAFLDGPDHDLGDSDVPDDDEPQPTQAPLSLIFSPPEDQIPSILQSCTDPDTTLRSIARDHSTTFDAFVLWMSKPEIMQKLTSIESALAFRTRLIAVSFLPQVATALTSMVEEYTHENGHIPIRPSNTHATQARARLRETARKASLLLMRLAKFNPVSALRMQNPELGRGESHQGTSPDQRRGTRRGPHAIYSRPIYLCIRTIFNHSRSANPPPYHHPHPSPLLPIQSPLPSHLHHHPSHHQRPHLSFVHHARPQLQLIQPVATWPDVILPRHSQM